MFLFTTPTPSLPRLNLPSRERLQRLGSSTLTALIWAVAITVTAGRLTRIGWAWFRPRLARLLHALALLLDGGLAYPDQPEPDPTPEPTHVGLSELVTSLEHVRAQATGLPAPAIDTMSALRVLRPDLAPPADEAPAPAAKPRAARRRTTAKAPAKGAAA